MPFLQIKECVSAVATFSPPKELEGLQDYALWIHELSLKSLYKKNAMRPVLILKFILSQHPGGALFAHDLVLGETLP